MDAEKCKQNTEHLNDTVKCPKCGTDCKVTVRVRPFPRFNLYWVYCPKCNVKSSIWISRRARDNVLKCWERGEYHTKGMLNSKQKQKVCKFCGKSFLIPAGRNHSKREYCSSKCKDKFNYLKVYQKHTGKFKNCSTCGKMFEVVKDKQQQCLECITEKFKKSLKIKKPKKNFLGAVNLFDGTVKYYPSKEAFCCEVDAYPHSIAVATLRGTPLQNNIFCFYAENHLSEKEIQQILLKHNKYKIVHQGKSFYFHKKTQLTAFLGCSDKTLSCKLLKNPAMFNDYNLKFEFISNSKEVG